MTKRKILSLLLAAALLCGCTACGGTVNKTQAGSAQTDSSAQDSRDAGKDSEEKAYIEETLNLRNNEDQEWTYSADSDAWVLSVVQAVAYPELPEQQGVSVCVPGAYVDGIDTDGDGKPDVTADTYEEAAKGSLLIDEKAEVTSTNGQAYTAVSAPVILNTGAAGYGSSNNSLASTAYAADGYINVACGNRGKQDTAEDEDGNTYYTGDAPSCLVDQKNAARFIKYNILLGNLPGSVDYFVSTGGSGGGAHAAMFAATSNHPDYYDYEIEAGAVGVYKNTNGSYSTTVTIDGKAYEITDGAWGCIAYSAITSLYEADMAMAFEYYLDTDYDFNTSFQAKLAEYLSAAYMDYINGQNLTVEEASVGFDLNEDGDQEDRIDLKIACDPEAYPETNGYYGTYLDLYLAEFTENLQWYLDHLDYAEDWTWFGSDGEALSDQETAAMTSEDKAEAFLEGRYDRGSSRTAGGMGGPGGEMPGAMGGNMPELTDGAKKDMPGGAAGKPDGGTAEKSDGGTAEKSDGETAEAPDTGDRKTLSESGREMIVGTPGQGTTQASDSSVDSSNYESFDDMVKAYKEDIGQISEGDEYGKNIVSLYNPLNYIGAEETEAPAWARIVMGASEGDMSMFSSLNMQIAWLNAGTDTTVEWQWDGGHVPSEVLGNSFSLYVDQMYGEYAGGRQGIEGKEAVKQTANGTADQASGSDISSWVNASDLASVSLQLADAASYRTAGASKATPGFDVIDYGQEDYVFGNENQDARHWNTSLLTIFETYADELEPLFQGKN